MEAFERYDMDNPKRGRCIVINNSDFKDPQLNRIGSEEDVKIVKATFAQLGFDVIVMQNLQAEEMVQTMKKFAHLDHSDCDCLAVVLMSHGQQGSIYGIDTDVKIDRLHRQFIARRCYSLTDKPKLFFIQACRGDGQDLGTTSQLDAMPFLSTVTKRADEADFLMAQNIDFLVSQSTVEGYISYRDKIKGSLYIQTLCRLLANYGATTNLPDILTMVNREVERGCHEVQKLYEVVNYKQMPSYTSSLRKQLFFTPKQFRIFVLMGSNSKSIQLPVLGDDTISSVIDGLKDFVSIPDDVDIRLMGIGGEPLLEERTLASYDIQNNSQLVCVQRLAGGMFMF